jgi:outer membrane protein assembly factor BamD (BamD/ComL family)
MKKFYFLVMVVGGVWWYASHRFNFADTMVYAQKHSSASWAPALEYSVGMVYYEREDYPKAEEAFNQLLTDFATGEYQARGLLRLSEAAEDNRDYQMARDAANRYIEEYPDGPDRAIAERRKEHLYNK